MRINLKEVLIAFATVFVVSGTALAQQGETLIPPVPNGDHFQCYMLEKGDRVKEEKIYIQDQFGGTRAVLGRPVMLCNPSYKKHGEKEFHVKDRVRHLVCYNYVKQNRPKDHRLIVNTQFGPDRVLSTRRALFCAPAGKAHIKDPTIPPVEQQPDPVFKPNN